jgi:predicted peroxiredoxin
MPNRRKFLEKSTQLAAAIAAATISPTQVQAQQPPALAKKLNILMRSSWGTDDPTRASFVFSHGLLLSDAGHVVQIFLTAEATYLMRKVTVDSVKPVGWPPLSETMAKIVESGFPSSLEEPAPGPVGSRKQT